MRHSPSPYLMRNAPGQANLLILPAGSAGEQLFGIQPLQELLGIDPVFPNAKQGLPLRTQCLPVDARHLVFQELKGTRTLLPAAVLMLDATANISQEPKVNTRTQYMGTWRHELYLNRCREHGIKTRAAWSKQDFGIMTSDLEVGAFLSTVHAGLLTGDGGVAIWQMLTANPYGRADLVIGLTARIDEADKLTLLQSDAELIPS